MTASTDSTSEQQLGLHWLIRLRWIAVCGQILICVVAAGLLGILLPWPTLVVCIGFTALSNAFLLWHIRRSGGGECWLMPFVLGADIVALTIMLYFTGGAHNPFTMFYLLHMTMAVILLPTWGAWGAVALCTAGFWCLFQSDHELVSRCGGTCCNDMRAHLQGMVVGMVLTGCGIAYFVSRLTAGLRASRRMTALAQADGERARRTMEVATLAAGIAHELATPLGTIAVVSQDLETVAGECCSNRGCAADARVIRQEVERCRLIIEKLGMAGRTEQEACKPLDWEKLGVLLSSYLSEPVRERLDLRLRPSAKRPLLPQSRLFQCLAILIKNAVEAAPAGTAVILEAEVVANNCVFRVTDQGPGFPPGYGRRIGEPMVTTKSKTGGLGLGLYLVKAFVVERGGELRLESGPGGETVLVMQVPLMENGS
ncbi:MAG: ATP-binding protein [Luteolibacter sp.]|nr:ATP-binding protein [Luteolibacter sp.]